MALEVELKAHVQDVDLVKNRLSSLAENGTVLCEVKDDIYYCNQGEDALFRIRLSQEGPSFDQMEGTVLFTRKYKSLAEGVEVNREVEFTTDPSQFATAQAFMLSLGYEQYIRKAKRGYLYTFAVSPLLPSVHAELVEVSTLGWFLELEFIVESDALVPVAKKALTETLERLGLEQTAVESRYYMHLLKEVQSRG